MFLVQWVLSFFKAKACTHRYYKFTRYNQQDTPAVLCTCYKCNKVLNRVTAYGRKPWTEDELKTLIVLRSDT